MSLILVWTSRLRLATAVLVAAHPDSASPREAATAAATLLAALLLDAALGEPERLYRRVPHPAVLIGRAIQALERRLLRPEAPERRKRRQGVLLLAILLAGAVALGWALHRLLLPLPGGWLVEAALMSTLLAQRSLVQHRSLQRLVLHPQPSLPARGSNARSRAIAWYSSFARSA